MADLASLARSHRATSKPGAAEVQPSPGKQTLTAQLPAHAGGGTNVHAAAQHATRGPGSELPFRSIIQRLFGRHDLSGVQAHTDEQAQQGAAAMGAQAFAHGDRVAFAGAPDLRTAAHEAAHVVQQRAGLQLAGGVGQAGDDHERHADEVAELVVRGQSAEAMLDRYAGGGGGAAVQRMAAYPGCRLELELMPRPTQDAYGEHYDALGKLLDDYLKVAGTDASAKLEGEKRASAKRRLDRIARRTVKILEAIQPGDRARLGDFVEYVGRLADAAGRERALRGWTTAAQDPLHGESMREGTRVRAKPNNDLDVEAQLAEYEGEFVNVGMANASREVKLKFLASLNKSNVVDTAKKTDHYAVREFLALDNGNWYRVEGQGKQEKSDGYVREDEMAVSRDHKPFSAPLFKRPPQVSDVQQGALGDCFLLAPLGAICRRDPGLIVRMVVDAGTTASVRFFRPALNGEFVPEWVTVDKSIVMSDSGGPKFAKSPWVAVIEKAYAAWAGNGMYGRITGGRGNEVLQHLIGKAADIETGSGDDADLAQRARTLLAQSNDRIMTINTKELSDKPHPQLVHSHAYELVSAQPDSLTLRNPHGTAKQDIDAEFALPDAMINQYFRSVSFEARPDPHANLQPLLGRLGKAEASAQTRDRALQYFAHLANATSPEVDSAAARDLLQRLADGESLVPGLPSAERRRLAEQARALL